MKVLFVCTGNTCRSPAAEALARAGGPSDVEFASAGTHARDGDPMSPEVVAALPADLDTSGFRSRPLTPRLLAEADLVVTMEAAHRAVVLEVDPTRVGRVVTLGHLAAVAGRAPDGLDRAALLAHLEGTRDPADPALDVPDPYRRGAEAASGCVARLEELLRAVLPALDR